MGGFARSVIRVPTLPPAVVVTARPHSGAALPASEKLVDAALAGELDDAEESTSMLSQADDKAPESDTDEPIYTSMTCYLGADETEICVYDGVLCYDGRGAVVSVPWEAPPPSEQNLKPLPGAANNSLSAGGPPLGVLLANDPQASCYDYRYYESSSAEYSRCAYGAAFERPLHLWDRVHDDTAPPGIATQAALKIGPQVGVQAAAGAANRREIDEDSSARFRVPGKSHPYPVGRRYAGVFPRHSP
jgi:hypothetical protein